MLKIRKLFEEQSLQQNNIAPVSKRWPNCCPKDKLLRNKSKKTLYVNEFQ